jgi:hypothetical protein
VSNVELFTRISSGATSPSSACHLIKTPHFMRIFCVLVI